MTALIQRPLRGSRISSFYPVKTLPTLASLDSAFQLQEYISLLIRLDVHDVDSIVAVPGKDGSKEHNEEEAKTEDKDGDKERKGEIVVDQACWIYEQLRRLAQDLTHPLITTLQQECTRLTCPEMKAGEWLYLCVAHGTDGAMEQCCAIDYILHTLDSATALLNSPRAFPSRLHIDKTSHRHFSSLARRLGRIFSHAYFHHREAFEQAEAESSLYARFLALTTKFELVPAEFQVIPPRISDADAEVQPPRLMAAGVDRSLEAEAIHRDKVEEDWISTGGRPKSKSPPGLRNESPRKFGRNRTDTMIHSEAASVAEELAKEEEAMVPAVERLRSLSPETISVEEHPPAETPKEESTSPAKAPPTEIEPEPPAVEAIPLPTPDAIEADVLSEPEHIPATPESMKASSTDPQSTPEQVVLSQSESPVASETSVEAGKSSTDPSTDEEMPPPIAQVASSTEIPQAGPTEESSSQSDPEETVDDSDIVDEPLETITITESAVAVTLPDPLDAPSEVPPEPCTDSDTSTVNEVPVDVAPEPVSSPDSKTSEPSSSTEQTILEPAEIEHTVSSGGVES
ncbi:mps one binder kinase activator-like 4 [Armillaria novae-zelandiae]|uniref:Mps one binder kinase activator-like 4 n=1 Tax=Armillaria novae-zelandiae TaxID=153914 RepID=A0AA39NXW3_9AGAR|nr:mps one binder kinase activator-like 4 [Armillaria novae-zelandiae]